MIVDEDIEFSSSRWAEKLGARAHRILKNFLVEGPEVKRVPCKVEFIEFV